MSFLSLFAIGLALLYEPTVRLDPADTPLRLAAMALGLASVTVFAWWSSVWTVRRLERHFDDRARILKQYHWLRWIHTFLGLVLFGVMVTRINWSGLVRYEWRLQGWFLLDEALLIAPYLLMEAFSYCFFFTVDRVIRIRLAQEGQTSREPWNRFQYLNYHLRAQLGIWLVCGVIVMTFRDVADWLNPQWGTDPTVATVIMGCMSATVLLLAPAIIRLVWQAAPLPAGVVRSRLEALGNQLGFRCSNILVWQTSGGVANAAITGIVPQLRYVLLSDALLDQLSPEEIEAVYGHEIGHIKHHHLTYYLGFVLASVVFIMMVAQLVDHAMAQTLPVSLLIRLQRVWSYVPLEMLLLVPYFGVVFGFLSRRFERQADLYGSRAASAALVLEPQPLSLASVTNATGGNGCLKPAAPSTTQGCRGLPPVLPQGVQVFIQSLEKVAILNGIARTLRSWRHGSIAKRIEFLERVAADPGLADRYDRRIRRLRWSVAALLFVGILSTGYFALSLERPPLPIHDDRFDRFSYQQPSLPGIRLFENRRGIAEHDWLSRLAIDRHDPGIWVLGPDWIVERRGDRWRVPGHPVRIHPLHLHGRHRSGWFRAAEHPGQYRRNAHS